MSMPYFLAAARIRCQASSRSSSVTPSTWSNRAIAFRRSGHVEQRVLLPSAEAGKVTASLSDGVLTMTVPRSEAEKSHRVEVTSG